MPRSGTTLAEQILSRHSQVIPLGETGVLYDVIKGWSPLKHIDIFKKPKLDQVSMQERKKWEIFWEDIKLIKSLTTSQGSKVYYFNTKKDDNFLMPQRIENFEKFLQIVYKNTGIDIKDINYISPLWTYKLLTFLSVLMIIGEIFAFIN